MLRRAPWRNAITDHARRLRYEVFTALGKNRNSTRVLEEVAAYILMAKNIAMGRVRPASWIRHLLSGTEGETAWAWLNRASETLIQFRSSEAIARDIPELQDRLVRHIDPDDPRLGDYLQSLARIEAALTSSASPQPPEVLTLGEETNDGESVYPPLAPEDRHKLQAITRAVNHEEVAALGALRAYRNLILIVTLFLVTVLFTLPWIASHLDTSLLAFTTPNSAADPAQTGQTQHVVTWLELATVEFWGCVGGLVGTLFALHRLRASSGPLGVHIVQALLKLPAGSLTALFGVVVLQGGLLSHVSPPTRPELAAYACLFGFSQEALTRLVDKKAGDLVGDLT